VFIITANETFVNQPFDGVLGLARNLPFLYGGPDPSPPGPLLVNTLYKSGVITEPTFSISYPYNEGAFIDFGPP